MRVGDVASNETELRRGSGDIVASKETDGRLRSGVFWSRDRGGEPTDIKAGDAVVTASTAWGVTMGTRSAGLEMEPRRRGDLILKTCAHVRVFEIPSVTSFARGPITRVALAPRINNPATKVRWVIILKRGALCWGTLVHHPKEKSVSRQIPRLRSSRGLRAFPEREHRQRSDGKFVASLRPAVRARGRRRRLADPCGFGSDKGRGGRRFGRSRQSGCGQQSTPQRAAK